MAIMAASPGLESGLIYVIDDYIVNILSLRIQLTRARKKDNFMFLCLTFLYTTHSKTLAGYLDKLIKQTNLDRLLSSYLSDAVQSL